LDRKGGEKGSVPRGRREILIIGVLKRRIFWDNDGGKGRVHHENNTRTNIALFWVEQRNEVAGTRKGRTEVDYEKEPGHKKKKGQKRVRYGNT